MIPVPSGVRVWLAVGRTDMRRGMNGLALQVQEALRRDPHAGDLYVFRGARGDLIKFLGMTVSACRSTPKGWRRDALSGHCRRTAWLESRPRNWPTCSTESIGAIRVIRFVRNVPDNSLTLHFFTSSSAKICDSIWSWIRVVKPFQMTSRR